MKGTTPGGVPYHANDPRLLDWAQATVTSRFTEAYHAYVRRLSSAEKDAAFAEGQASSVLYGATGAAALIPMADSPASQSARRLAKAGNST